MVSGVDVEDKDNPIGNNAMRTYKNCTGPPLGKVMQRILRHVTE
jgi:hypothetical protein